jgi:hypothetical protein
VSKGLPQLKVTSQLTIVDSSASKETEMTKQRIVRMNNVSKRLIQEAADACRLAIEQGDFKSKAAYVRAVDRLYTFMMR